MTKEFRQELEALLKKHNVRIEAQCYHCGPETAQIVVLQGNTFELEDSIGEIAEEETEKQSN